MTWQWPPAGETVLDSAHGVAVTWAGNGRYTVWSHHPSGRWVENRVWQGPRGDADAVEAAAARLVAEQLGGRNKPVTVSSTGDEDVPRLARWRSDEDYLVSSPEVCGTEGCSCGKKRDVLIVAPEDTPVSWGPLAAEAAVEAGWEREAAARSQAGGWIIPAVVPEPDGDDGPTEAEAPWGVLPSQKQMAAQRDADYGHPGPNFTTTAAMWSEYINAKYGTALRLDTDDVPAMNVLQKVARQARRQKRDNWDDISGYADTAVMAAPQ